MAIKPRLEVVHMPQFSPSSYSKAEAGPASKLPHDGFEPPSHCAFDPDGALYIVDFGEIEIAPAVGGIRVQRESGTLWRIRRTEGLAGDQPPQPVVLPLNALQIVLAAGAALLTLSWAARRLFRRRR